MMGCKLSISVVHPEKFIKKMKTFSPTVQKIKSKMDLAKPKVNTVHNASMTSPLSTDRSDDSYETIFLYTP